MSAPALRGDMRNLHATRWSWSWLRFPVPTITPMDCDGVICVHPDGVSVTQGHYMIERCGAVLFIETKRPNEDISVGELRTLKALARLKGATVLIVRGHPEQSIPLTYQQVRGSGRIARSVATSRQHFNARCVVWFQRAEAAA